MDQVLAQTVQVPSLADDHGNITAEKVLHAVEKIVAKVDPLRVTAFGSRARGTHHAESDLDLAVMVSQYDPKRDKLPIYRRDLDVFMSIDLLVFGKQRHEFMKDSIISVHHDIANEGVVLYDKSVGSIDLGAVGRVAR